MMMLMMMMVMMTMMMMMMMIPGPVYSYRAIFVFDVHQNMTKIHTNSTHTITLESTPPPRP